MSRQLPFLALDSAGNRTILNDYSLPMSGGKVTTKKEKTMSRVMTNQEVQSHAKKLVARLLGQDASLDDETTGRLKEFLKSRLSGADHEAVCSMLDGEPSAAGEDDLPENAIERSPEAKKGVAGLATDSASFNSRFPGLAHIRSDNSGIQPRSRGGSYSDAAAKSFADRYPGLQGIKQA
jgi:hypothetical protein